MVSSWGPVAHSPPGGLPDDWEKHLGTVYDEPGCVDCRALQRMEAQDEEFESRIRRWRAGGLAVGEEDLEIAGAGGSSVGGGGAGEGARWGVREDSTWTRYFDTRAEVPTGIERSEYSRQLVR